MPDYYCYPLWEASPGVIGNIDPDTLPISSDLKLKILNWAAEFDATLDVDYPPNSGFSSKEHQVAFEDCGRELERCLQAELGGEYIVHLKLFI